MRREGRIHGYEFDRLRRHSATGDCRVKASRTPTNRSKFGAPRGAAAAASSTAQSPVQKSLKKAKGFRNKKPDVNASLRDWSFRSSPRRSPPSPAAIAAAADLPDDEDVYQPPDFYYDEEIHESLHATSSSSPMPIPCFHVVDSFPPLPSSPPDLDYESDGSDWFDVAESDDFESGHVDDDDWYLC